MRKALLLLVALAFAAPAFAQTDPTLPPSPRVVNLYAGANGVWFDDDARPSDLELGGNVAASLQPNIAAVGAAYFGVDHSYLRGSLGVRVTATDVDNPLFSIGLGIQYQASSEPELRPEEWCPDASIGWRPWPTQKDWIVVGQAAYGLDSNNAYLVAGIRYNIHTGGAQ